jgi:hypothetical protein
MAVVLTACGGGPNKTIDLSVTLIDGTVVKTSLTSQGGFFFDGQGRATAAFPPIAEWTAKAPVGLSMRLTPLQPGRYGTSGNLHLGGEGLGASKPVTLDLSIERVRWQGDGAYPFRVEGTVKGTSAENHKVEGRFSTTVEDCTDASTANSKTLLCGGEYPSKAQAAQRWGIDSWVTEGECPDAVFKRFAGGKELSIDGSFASLGGQKDLRCVRVSDTKAICGGNEEGFQADGCAWAITVVATPAIASKGEPQVGLFAGTTAASCPARLCAMRPRAFVHLSGAN